MKEIACVPSSCHNHTTFCDGKNTPQEMAQAALAAGFTAIGFSGHSRTRYPSGQNYGVADEAAYVQALQQLRAQYAGKLDISIGMEQDYFAPVQNRKVLDYIIGSVHDIRDEATGEYYWVDGPLQRVQACCSEVFGGDIMALVRHFYALTVRNAQQEKPEIIGHFDLVCKNNVQGRLFDENSGAYRTAALEALDACLETGAVFEVNTGGIYRGYLQRPYPAVLLLRRLHEKGARVMISADAHEAAALTYRFTEMQQLLRHIGFREITVLQNNAFVQKNL